MIIVLTHKPTPEDRAAEVFASFAGVVHSRVPFGHSIDLHSETLRERGFCGEHGRVLTTWQGLCPVCAGHVIDAGEVARIVAIAKSMKAAGIYDAEHARRLREKTAA